MEDIVVDMTRARTKSGRHSRKFPASTVFKEGNQKTEAEVLEYAEELLYPEYSGRSIYITDLGKTTLGSYSVLDNGTCVILLSDQLLNASWETIKKVVLHELRHHQQLEELEELLDKETDWEEEE